MVKMNQNLGPAEFCAVEVDCVAELELGSGSGFLFVVLCSDVPAVSYTHLTLPTKLEV